MELLRILLNSSECIDTSCVEFLDLMRSLKLSVRELISADPVENGFSIEGVLLCVFAITMESYVYGVLSPVKRSKIS